ncbi:MAG: alpha/beta hydrolase [Myxococcaceae bacterium]|nr:alpha/beta hydrolase [Myxococcaceae bacterium]
MIAVTAGLGMMIGACASAPRPEPTLAPVQYGFEKVGSTSVFFREAGATDRPTLLLLHGFPASSHQYRRLLDALGTDLNVIAPDYPGFGFTEAPPTFEFTFDKLTDTIEGFCKQQGLDHFFIYMFDFGAPVGFRLALRHPEWIRGIITQNGNAYVDGIAPPIAEMIAIDAKATPERAARVRATVLSLEEIKAQYLTGAAHPEHIAPESWLLDGALLARPERTAAMLSLLDDYKTNLASYPAWQSFLRTRRPPLLVVWGRDDPIFLEAGAHAFRRDVPEAQVYVIPGGHFLSEEQPAAIAALLRGFVAEHGNER